MTGELTIGGLVAFNMLAGRVAQPILRLARLWQDFQQVRISIDRPGRHPQHPPRARRPGPRRHARHQGGVEFKEVQFRYRPDRPPVLKGISLAVPQGQVVGIVDPSGPGSRC